MAEQRQNGTPAKNEAGLEVLSARYILRSQISSLRTTFKDDWKQTPQRSKDVRALLNGDKKAPIPKGFKLAGADQFRCDTPHKYLEPYHQRNLIAKDQPRVKRWKRGDAIPLESEATRIENIMQAVMDDRYPWARSVDIVQNDGVAIQITLLDIAAMSRTPSLYEDGQQDLPDNKKTVKPRYQRDANGKMREEVGKGFRVNKKASAKALSADKRDILSRKIPLQIEVLPPTAFIPVFGPDYTLDAVLVERWWTTTELLRKRFLWDGSETHLSPAGSATDNGQTGTTGSATRFKVTELYAVDYVDGPDGIPCPHPYVAYMVDAKNNGQLVRMQKVKDGGVVDALVDLYNDYGLERLPATIRWGPSWPGATRADEMAMPFPLPFAQSWMAIDAILTGAVVWSWWRGFPTLIEQPNPSSPPDIDVQDDSPDDELEFEPMSIIRAKGTVTELGTQGPAAIVTEIVQLLSGANREEGPPGAASGGDASSGFQASLARAFADDAMGDTKNGCIELYKDAASIGFESLTGWAKKFGPIPIQKITKVPLGARSRDGRSKREILDLTEDLAGGLFDIDADFPPQPNLAKGQQWAEWVQLGLVLLEEFREEIIGDPNPEVFIARRLKQKIMDSPEFQQKVMALVAQLSGDAEEKQRILALTSGAAQQGTDGQVRPAANAFGVPPALAPGGQMMPGPVPTGGGGPPNPAQLSLAGAVGGPVGAAQAAAAAGGNVPANLPGIG